MFTELRIRASLSPMAVTSYVLKVKRGEEPLIGSKR